MKLIYQTLKLITFQNETIGTSYQFLFSTAEYTSKFKKIYKWSKFSRVYIFHKIEFAIPISVLNYGNRQQLSNIFDTLVTNGAYLHHNKFRAHTKHLIGFFTHINPKVTLRNNLRIIIQDEFIWIDLNDEESASLIHQLKDNAGILTGKQNIVIPAFGSYNKQLGDDNGNDRITTFAYEIRTSPTNKNILKNLLCKIFNEDESKLRFISYKIQSLSKQGTMKNIILQHNIFLQNMVIVPIININEKHKEQVKKILESSSYFSRFEATRKVSEGMYVPTDHKQKRNQQDTKKKLTNYY